MKTLTAWLLAVIFSASLAGSAVGAQLTATVPETNPGQITDTVPQTDPMVLGTSPGAAMSTLYQVTAQALSKSAANSSISPQTTANTMGVSVLAVVAHTQAYLLGD